MVITWSVFIFICFFRTKLSSLDFWKINSALTEVYQEKSFAKIWRRYPMSCSSTWYQEICCIFVKIFCWIVISLSFTPLLKSGRKQWIFRRKMLNNRSMGVTKWGMLLSVQGALQFSFLRKTKKITTELEERIKSLYTVIFMYLIVFN